MSKPLSSTATTRRKVLPKAMQNVLREKASSAIANPIPAEPQEVGWGDVAVIIGKTSFLESKGEAAEDWKGLVFGMRRPELRESYIRRFRAFQRGYPTPTAQADDIGKALDVVRKQLESIKLEMERKVQELTAKVDKLSPLQQLFEDEPHPEQSAELAWCSSHIEEIRAHAPAFLAIDVANDSIVIVAKTQDEFIARLNDLSPDKLSSLYRVHTAMFV